jgi:methionyl-tRNA formyltransferase
MTHRTRVALVSPHPRHDKLERELRQAPDLDVMRIRTRDELVRERIDVFGPRYLFFAHWSWKIPPELHENHECVIFHMTDVPFGRGGSPLQNLIARGVEVTMLSALRCVEAIDAGPVYMKQPLSTLGTAEEVLGRAARLMLPMILTIVRDNPAPLEQTGEVVEFQRRTPDQSNAIQVEGLRELFDFIRMLDADGYPPAFIEVGGFRLEFTRASLKSDSLYADVRITQRKETGV